MRSNTTLLGRALAYRCYHKLHCNTEGTNGTSPAPEQQAHVEKKWILLSIIACFLTFAGYLVYCVRVNNASQHDETAVHNMKAHAAHEKATELGHMHGVQFSTRVSALVVPLNFTPLLRLMRCHLCDLMAFFFGSPLEFYILPADTGNSVQTLKVRRDNVCKRA